MARSKAVTAWEGFQTQIQEREAEIGKMLPAHIKRSRFISAAIAAVKQTPGLLEATDRSLMTAVTKAAQDGLLPDGREGVITLYNTKGPDNKWHKEAQWNPMAWGLRKRARELDGIIVSTNVVHENDEFEHQEGDDPKIVHKPAKMGTERGPMIGAYAIFRQGDDILHREVMDADQIQAVREQSRAPGGLLWTKFVAEAWRKTVLRRGFKSIPASEKLEEVVTRDDDMFAFDDEPVEIKSTGKTRPKAEVIQPPEDGERKALPPVVGEDVVDVEPEPDEEAQPEPETQQAPETEPEPSEAEKPPTENVMPKPDEEPDRYLDHIEKMMASIKSQAALDELWLRNVEPYIDTGALFPIDLTKVRGFYDANKKRLSGA